MHHFQFLVQFVLQLPCIIIFSFNKVFTMPLPRFLKNHQVNESVTFGHHPRSTFYQEANRLDMEIAAHDQKVRELASQSLGDVDTDDTVTRMEWLFFRDSPQVMEGIYVYIYIYFFFLWVNILVIVVGGGFFEVQWWNIPPCVVYEM